MRPTGDGVATGALAALLLLVAVNLQAGWVYAVDALLLGLLVVGWLSARLGLRGIIVNRTLPPNAFEGDAVAVTLRVALWRGRGYGIELHDVVPGLTPKTVFVPVCDARHPATLTYATTAAQRGVHRVEGLEACSFGLAGQFVMRRRVDAPGTITVFPRYWALGDLQLPGRSGEDAAPVPRPSRDGLEIAGVREYREGDSLRHVHWRSTARRGTLVVREFEHEATDPVSVLLDTRSHLFETLGGPEAFEDLVRATASIVRAVTRSGRPVQLLGARGTQALSVVADWAGALHWLARIQPEGMLTPSEVYAAGCDAATAVVICSADPDAAAVMAQHEIPLAAVLVDVASYAQPRSRSDAGEMLLQALGVRVALLRGGEDGRVCLASLCR